jgi:hypothetical protein
MNDQIEEATKDSDDRSEATLAAPMRAKSKFASGAARQPKAALPLSKSELVLKKLAAHEASRLTP